MNPEQNTVTIKAVSAKYLAVAALAAIPTSNDITPSINAGRFTVAEGRVTVTSTDRYRVHRASVAVEGDAADHTFLMPRELLVWLSKNAGTFSSGRSAAFSPVVTITTTPPKDAASTDQGACEIRVQRDPELATDIVTMSGTLQKGNFPPVERLFDEAKAAERSTGDLSFNLDYLASMRALSPWAKFSPKFKFTVSKNPAKPGPVLITFDGGSVFAEALLQPVISL